MRGRGEAYELILRIIRTFSCACLSRSSSFRFFRHSESGTKTRTLAIKLNEPASKLTSVTMWAGNHGSNEISSNV
jgi:hypothetical protein